MMEEYQRMEFRGYQFAYVNGRCSLRTSSDCRLGCADSHISIPNAAASRRSIIGLPNPAAKR